MLGCVPRVLLVLAALVAVAGAAEKTPSFVVILCDDLGYSDLGCYGHPHIQTPRLDRLAGEGLRLTDCYASAPVCSPSRVGMLTGRTPYRAGIYDWIPDKNVMHLRPHEVTVAKLLKSAGYATCHVGKWHCNGKFNSKEQPQPGDHGFDHWFSTQNNALPNHKDPRNFVRNGEPVGPLTGWSSQLIVDEGLRWLEKQPADQSVCLFVWFHSPHEIVATPDEFIAPYRKVAKNEDQAIYFGNVAQVDHEVGRLLDVLDASGRGKDTLVLFTSDNGPETLNRYRTANHSWGSPVPLRGMKLHMYEGGLRVPGILRWPGRIATKQTSTQPVSNIDVLPTLCELAGAAIPTDLKLDGASLVPLFAGQEVRREKPLYWQYDKALGTSKVALRDGDWKVLADESLKTFELYNLRSDLSESKNLADSEPKRLAEMSEKLKAFHADVARDRPVWEQP